MSRRSLHPRLVPLAAVTAMVLTLAACNGDSGTAPQLTLTDAELTSDLALQTGDAIAASAVEFDVEEGLATVPGAGCPLAPGSTTRRTCARTTANGLTVERSYEFFDAALSPMAQYDANTTASIGFRRSIDGTQSRPGFTAFVHRVYERTVSGLAGAESQRVWNGTGSVRDTTTHTGNRGTRRYIVTANENATNVVVTVPRSANRYPLSGSITRTMTAVATFEGARSAARTVTRSATVTFNGTAEVPIRIGTASCTLNLDTRTVAGCSTT